MRSQALLLALPLAAAFSAPPAPWTAGAGISPARAGACSGALQLRAQVIGEHLCIMHLRGRHAITLAATRRRLGTLRS
jgi:hypothetical protein